MSIAILMQTHFVSAQIIAQIQAFLDRGHRVLVSVDADAAFSEIKLEFEHDPKCDVIRSMPVSWCGMSQIDMFIHGLSLLRSYSDWKFIVNISGNCILFRPLKDLEAYLDTLIESGIEALVGSFVSKFDLSQPITVNDWLHAPWTRLERYAQRDLNVVVPQPTAEDWIDLGRSPIVNSSRRIAYHASEDSSTKTLTIRPLLGFEHHARLTYFRNNKLHIGRAWYALTRTAVDWLVDHGTVSYPWALMKDSFEPDEYLIHTVILNGATHLKVMNSNLQFDHGRTDFISYDEVMSIVSNQECHKNFFFIRKASLDLEQVDRIKSDVWLRT